MGKNKKQKCYKITEKDYILAVKKAERELEIELHGKQISTRPTRIHKSKKIYDRKRNKGKFPLA